MAQLEVIKAFVEVLPDRCKGCELCVVTCPQGNLQLSHEFNKIGYHPVEFHHNGSKGSCTACGICYWVCPDGAIHAVYMRKR
jgi:2-oxoglutarate ferredoxin oxidoreductase subunit delta